MISLPGPSAPPCLADPSESSPGASSLTDWSSVSGSVGTTTALSRTALSPAASRLWLLAACTVLAAPLAVGTLHFPPPGAFVCLLAYYFFAETWFAVLFTVIVEIVQPEVNTFISFSLSIIHQPLLLLYENYLILLSQVRSTCIAVFLFLMNLVGGNLPVIVAPLRLYFEDYRTALYLVWPGFLSISAAMFLLASLPLRLRERRTP